jgi:hypothetical protein
MKNAMQRKAAEAAAENERLSREIEAKAQEFEEEGTVDGVLKGCLLRAIDRRRIAIIYVEVIAKSGTAEKYQQELKKHKRAAGDATIEIMSLWKSLDDLGIRVGLVMEK